MVRNLLIIECQPRVNHYPFYEGAKLENGEDVVAFQATWDEFSFTSYSNGEVYVQLKKKRVPEPPTNLPSYFKLDFILMRSVTHGLHGKDAKNKLYGLIFADVPSVNSLQSCLMHLERPVADAALFKLAKKYGDRFPMLPSTYFPSFSSMIISPGFPCVVKLGHYHAGYGKIKVDNSKVWDDVRSLVAAAKGQYCMAQKFIDWDYDIRIQKIGKNYRVFKRMSANWKGNVGSSVIEDIPMTPEYQFMIDEAAKSFGGLDICALDLVHEKSSGKEYILECNDTAIGLVRKYEPEDHSHIRDLVLEKMNSQFCASADISDSSSSVASTSGSSPS